LPPACFGKRADPRWFPAGIENCATSEVGGFRALQTPVLSSEILGIPSGGALAPHDAETF
jgi:hypothetical protein